MMNQPSMRVMSKEYMLAHAGECVKISDDGLSFEAVECGGDPDIPPTSYASNAEAVAALGLGKIYKTAIIVGTDGIQQALSITV